MYFGYYKDETEQRAFIESPISDILNKLLNTSGKYYNDVPPGKPSIVDYGTHKTYKPHKFLIGPIHESQINFK